MNVLKHHGIIAGPMGRTGRDTDIFVANSGHIVLATHGGFVELLVELNDKVETGQKVAIQRNTFGEVVAEYTSEVAGEIAVRRTDATAEPGTLLLAILYNRAPPESVSYSRVRTIYSCSMCGPKFCSMAITRQVRDHAPSSPRSGSAAWRR